MTPLLAFVLIICHVGCLILLLGLGRMAFVRWRRVVDSRDLAGADDIDRFILKKAFRRDLLYFVCAICFTLIPLGSFINLGLHGPLLLARSMFYGGFLGFLAVFAANVVLDNIDEARLTGKINDAKGKAVAKHVETMHEGELP